MSPQRLQLVALLFACSACGSDNGEVLTDAGTNASLRAQVLASIGENVIVPRLVTFEASAATLVANFSGDGGEGARVAAQDAWRAAMSDWQYVEMMQVGPIGAMDLTSGGEDARDNIYAWDLRNLCAIDQRTVADFYDNPTTLAEDTVELRGLGAIAYLLFAETTDNYCSPLSSINAEGTWASFSEQEIEQRRFAQAKALSTLVAQQAEALVQRWTATGGNFIAELNEPTRPGALFGSAQEGLNGVSDAMFYLDKETKDMKLGKPAGIIECAEDTCPEAVEFPFARTSTDGIRKNLEAFGLLYRGGEKPEDPGFDALLRSMEATEFAESMDAHIDDAIAAVDEIDSPLQEAVNADGADVAAAHAAIRVVTDDLKTMFLSVLDLEIPNRAAGDND